jgi:hypothetical protein
MKLEEYAVRQALLDERWIEAAGLVARHFHQEVDFQQYQFRTGHVDPKDLEIIIYLKEGGFISWASDLGFAEGLGGAYLWRGNVLVGRAKMINPRYNCDSIHYPRKPSRP